MQRYVVLLLLLLLLFLLLLYYHYYYYYYSTSYSVNPWDCFLFGVDPTQPSLILHKLLRLPLPDLNLSALLFRLDPLLSCYILSWPEPSPLCFSFMIFSCYFLSWPYPSLLSPAYLSGYAPAISYPFLTPNCSAYPSGYSPATSYPDPTPNCPAYPSGSCAAASYPTMLCFFISSSGISYPEESPIIYYLAQRYIYSTTSVKSC